MIIVLAHSMAFISGLYTGMLCSCLHLHGMASTCVMRRGKKHSEDCVMGSNRDERLERDERGRERERGREKGMRLPAKLRSGMGKASY